MKKVVLLVLLSLLLVLPAHAQSIAEQEAGILGAEALTEGLDEEALERLGGVSPTAPADLAASLWRLLTDALHDVRTPLRDAAKTCGMLLAATLLCSLCAQLEPSLSAQAVRLGGALALTAICAGGLRSMIGLAAGTLDRIGTFVTFLLPVLSAALSASGGMTSAAALYAGSMLFIDVLMRLIRSLLIPLTYAFTALSAAECAVGGETLQRLRELTGWIIQTALKGVMYVFTAYLTATGLIAGSADAAAVKAAGSALSTAVPVVGSILSGAAGTVLAGADIVRNYAGVFGLLAILATGLAPFCRIGVHYLALKLTAAVGGTMQCSGLGGLLSNLSAAMGYMLGLEMKKRFGGRVEADEIGIPVLQTGEALPCGSSARWTAE